MLLLAAWATCSGRQQELSIVTVLAFRNHNSRSSFHDGMPLLARLVYSA
jgi:hypothetical protein